MTMTPGEFYAIVLAYCAAMGASITSGRRTYAHNATVGGVAGSAHRFGLAFDLVYDAPALPSVRVAMAERLGLKLLVESDHDHVQPLAWPAG